MLLPIFEQCCENCVAYRAEIAAEDAGRPVLSIQRIFAEHFAVTVVENDKKKLHKLSEAVSLKFGYTIKMAYRLYIQSEITREKRYCRYIENNFT